LNQKTKKNEELHQAFENYKRQVDEKEAALRREGKLKFRIKT